MSPTETLLDIPGLDRVLVSNCLLSPAKQGLSAGPPAPPCPATGSGPGPRASAGTGSVVGGCVPKGWCRLPGIYHPHLAGLCERTGSGCGAGRGIREPGMPPEPNLSCLGEQQRVMSTRPLAGGQGACVWGLSLPVLSPWMLETPRLQVRCGNPWVGWGWSSQSPLLRPGHPRPSHHLL